MFKDILSDIGDNAASYAGGVWNNFVQQAKNEINGLATYYLLGEKKVSLLNYDLDYIKNSLSIVNGKDDASANKGRKIFTYYPEKGSGKASTVRDGKTVLADPNNDSRRDIQDDFQTPTTPKTQFTSNGVNIAYHYTEKKDKELTEEEYYASLSENDEGILNYKGETLVDRTSRWIRGICNREEDEYISKRFHNTISRFSTNTNGGPEISEFSRNLGITSYSGKYGQSHGRNLRKVTPTMENGYENPYCRVWTWHHQYSKLVRDTMRPFSGESQTTLSEGYNWDMFRSQEGIDGKDGGIRLSKYGKMYDNRGNNRPLVNITPHYDDKGNWRVKTEQTMFSIENLAWKGHTRHLSTEQIGPLGGRIMWFPPYDLKFNENTGVQWERNVFIGRGEPVYTYSNSERGGTLSFKLLIDHPAILDYWEGRSDKKDPLESAHSGVDDINSREQELLRFFAGCGILTAKKPPKPEPDPEPDPITPNPTPEPIENVLQFMVFFPNNYSGKDDGFEGTNVVNPIDYLVHGVGTQKRYNVNNPDTPEDFGVDMTKVISYENNVVGGYEMGDHGVSLVTEATKSNAIAGVVIDGYQTAYNNVNLDSLTLSDILNNIINRCESGSDAKYASVLHLDFSDGEMLNLANQLKEYCIKHESGAFCMFDNNSKTPYFTDADDFKAKVAEIGLADVLAVYDTSTNMYYFVGRESANAVYALSHGEYYFGENQANQLLDNASADEVILMKMVGSNKAKSAKNCPKSTKKANEWHKCRYYYRADNDTLNQVLEGDGATSYIDKGSSKLNSKGYMTGVNNFGLEHQDTTYSFADVYAAIHQDNSQILGSHINKDNVAIIKDILSGNKGKITGVTCKGHASSQGNNQSQATNQKRNNSLALNRAKTVQKWLKKNLKGDGIEFSAVEYTVQNKKTANPKDSNDQGAKLNRCVIVEIRYNQEEVGDATGAQISVNSSGKTDSVTSNPMSTIVVGVMPDSLKTAGVNDESDNEYWPTTTTMNEVAITASTNTETLKRYDNEAKFFEKINANHPMVVKLIKDKIKYFDPVFHSMSPEGFNARLTFLNQCTRQGPTLSNSDLSSGNANNLSFGMSPVCVLRVGDFFNSKIIIESIDISYDPMTWDLNMEGIGVMPMIADVSMTFKFIGGSELGGPISRLQNALSFNFYGNTSVYDNRAEQIEYDFYEPQTLLPFEGNSNINYE